MPVQGGISSRREVFTSYIMTLAQPVEKGPRRSPIVSVRALPPLDIISSYEMKEVERMEHKEASPTLQRQKKEEGGGGGGPCGALIPAV